MKELEDYFLNDAISVSYNCNMSQERDNPVLRTSY